MFRSVNAGVISGRTMEKSESERVAALEQEVAELRKLVTELHAKLNQLEKSIPPMSSRVRVVGSLQDSISKSLNQE